MMTYTRYDEATGETAEVELTPEEEADFNAKLAAHEAAQAALIQEQPTNPGE